MSFGIDLFCEESVMALKRIFKQGFLARSTDYGPSGEYPFVQMSLASLWTSI
jgi:hypothetical protein